VLLERPVPEIKDISSDLPFHAVMIGKDAFEECWKAATMTVAA